MDPFGYGNKIKGGGCPCDNHNFFNNDQNLISVDFWRSGLPVFFGVGDSFWKACLVGPAGFQRTYRGVSLGRSADGFWNKIVYFSIGTNKPLCVRSKQTKSNQSP